MSYSVRIFSTEDIGDPERQQAVQRFKAALEDSLGDAALVVPVYRIWLKLYQAYRDHQRPWPISDAEQLLADQWEAAELAAIRAAFGANRYMGDAHFELDVAAS